MYDINKGTVTISVQFFLILISNSQFIEMNNAEEVHKALREEGIVCDLRDKNILRLAFCPMYNTPEEIALLLERLENLIR